MNKLVLEVLIQLKKIILFFVLGFSITTVEAQCISGNCINGEGTFVYKDGSKFIGNFENGKKLFGKYYYPSGAIY